jgi:hypothetical protein
MNGRNSQIKFNFYELINFNVLLLNLTHFLINIINMFFHLTDIQS